MKRLVLLAVVALVVSTSSGCRCLFPCFGCCFPGGGMGCGETYWGDWPNCCDSCDNCGNWIAPHFKPWFPFCRGQCWYDPPCGGCGNCGSCCGAGGGFGGGYGEPMYDGAVYEGPVYDGPAYDGPVYNGGPAPAEAPYYDDGGAPMYEGSRRPGPRPTPAPTRAAAPRTYPTMSRQPHSRAGCKHCQNAAAGYPPRF